MLLAALGLGFGRAARAGAAPSQPATPVNFDVPAAACDCHTHIFGDPARFTFAPTRTYTPEPASVDELRRLHRALHVGRVVIVQPSVYGTDNACTLDALRQLGASARGVAVIDDAAPTSRFTASITVDRIARKCFKSGGSTCESRGCTSLRANITCGAYLFPSNSN